MAVVEYFEEVASRVIVEVDKTPVIEDEEVRFGIFTQELGVTPVRLCDGEFLEETRKSSVAGVEAIAAGFVSECASEPRFPNASGTGDDNIEVAVEIVTVGELSEETFVEAAAVSIVDVFDTGWWSKASVAQSIEKAFVGAFGGLAVDEQAESFFEGEGFEIVHVHLLGESAVHADEFE